MRQDDSKWDKKARELHQRGVDEEEQEVRARQAQIKRPWLREDADKPPVQEKEKPPLTKGKLLTTPTRLLKLILPLPVSVEKDRSNNGRDYARSVSPNDEIQPLALLVHPQQPLSYVERLIQAELPPVIEDGKEKIPNVYFRAEDTEAHEDNTPALKSEAKYRKETNQPSASAVATGDNKTPANVASFSGLGREGPDRKHKDKNWVRWSSSTEMGDFIRDAARGREFVIEIEGYGVEMPVAVPSFNDRTYYMRVRLRKMCKQIDEMAQIKHECDLIAHRSAHRLAKGGFALLSGWWFVVYYITFHTEAGWDLVEPVTYLAGLTTIMGGYLWFLYISRDLSYKAAMNITVSRRQNALYEARGLDIHHWDNLVQEANALRKEIKAVAAEYDVEWDETKMLGEEVKEVLDKENKKGKGPAMDDIDEGEDKGDDDKSSSDTEQKKTQDKAVEAQNEKIEEAEKRA